VDPSAESLHVGNLLPLLALLHFMRHGHNAVVLIGGATGMIGDPSGRNSERQALSVDEVTYNVGKITEQVKDFYSRVAHFANANDLSSSGIDIDARLRVVNNAHWYENMNVLDFLREVGKHARVSNMLARDSVRSRMEHSSDSDTASGLSFTEFSYQLLQAHDFSVLHERPWSCTVQLGGSDQMGNIAAGVDLIRRKKALQGNPASSEEGSSDPAYGLTLPLLTTSSGAKFGKSAGNAVWLDENRCSNYDFYQYFLRSRDEDVELYLRTLTLLPLSSIKNTMDAHRREPAARLAQSTLARQMTEMTRGSSALRHAEVITQVLHGQDLSSINQDEVIAAFGNDQRLKRLPRDQAIGVPVTKLAAKLKLCQSNSAARQVANNGGLYLNNVSLRNPSATLTEQDCIAGTNLVFLRIGSKEHAVLVLT
jgi:tyrosyl-tRNA synthetase